MSDQIKIGAIYRHYKEGNRYKVLNTAKHSETQEDMVIYRSLCGDEQIWVRPLSMWNDVIPKDKLTGFKQDIRFKEDYKTWYELEDISLY